MLNVYKLGFDLVANIFLKIYQELLHSAREIPYAILLKCVAVLFGS